MDADLFLVVGIVLFALSIPTLLSAWVDGRVPRAGAIIVLIAGALVATALTRHVSGYTFAEIPDVFFRVIGRYIN